MGTEEDGGHIRFDLGRPLFDKPCSTYGWMRLAFYKICYKDNGDMQLMRSDEVTKK